LAFKAGVERTGDERKMMNLTDPVADFLTRIRNAQRARHQKLDVPASKLKAEVARILKEEGYIANYKPAEEDGQKVLRVYLKYGPNNEAVIRDLKRISRPGCRVYIGKDEIKRVQGGLGISIMTTPKGVMTGRQARREGVGGEILAEVW
jgi:small subunit ribosomal protein S8